MTTDTTLIEKREELKRRLAAGEYKTLVDIFLEWFDRLIRKIIRQSKPLPIWLITIVLSLVFTLIGFAILYFTGDLTTFHKISKLGKLEYESIVLWTISNIVLVVVGSIFINLYIRQTFVFWRNEMLNAIESVLSLNEFEDWLEKVCNRRLHILITIIGGLTSILLLVIPLSSLLREFVGYGFTLVTIIINIFVWSLIYQLFLIVMLSAGLRRYHLKLFASDPGSSELVSRLSGELSLVVYFVAIFAVVLTFTTALVGLLPTFGFLLLLFYWNPIIAIFIINQTSLSTIIRRVKWKTLNEIQMKVEKLQTSRNFGNQETMDAIKRLMDYHDRVKATRDSALDFRAYLGFINSLLLPLLAFLLGNLDLVLKLFGIKP